MRSQGDLETDGRYVVRSQVTTVGADPGWALQVVRRGCRACIHRRVQSQFTSNWQVQNEDYRIICDRTDL